jgi:hypothetical protein
MFSEEKNITLEEFASLFTWEEVWIQDPATGEVSALKRVIRLKKEGER